MWNNYLLSCWYENEIIYLDVFPIEYGSVHSDFIIFILLYLTIVTGSYISVDFPQFQSWVQTINNPVKPAYEYLPIEELHTCPEEKGRGSLTGV